MAVGVADIFFFIFCGAGMLINAWVVLAFLVGWKRLMEFPHNIFIFNLALSDGFFSGAFFVTGLYMIRHDKHMGDQFPICDGAGYLCMFLPCVSICVLAAIAISTAHSLHRPFTSPKTKKRYITGGIIAIYCYAATLIGFAWLGDGRPRVYTNDLICTADWQIDKHWALATLCNMAGFFGIMIGAYSFTAYVVVSHHSHVAQEQGANSVLAQQKRDLNLRLGKRLAILVIVYVVVWIPFAVSLLWDLSGRKAADRSRSYDSAAIILIISGTIINPLVYAFVNDDIRSAYHMAVQVILRDRPRMILSSLIRRSKRKTMPTVVLPPGELLESQQTEMPTANDNMTRARPLSSGGGAMGDSDLHQLSVSSGGGGARGHLDSVAESTHGRADDSVSERHESLPVPGRRLITNQSSDADRRNNYVSVDVSKPSE